MRIRKKLHGRILISTNSANRYVPAIIFAMAHCSHHIGGVIGGRTLQVNVTSGELWKAVNDGNRFFLASPLCNGDILTLTYFFTGTTILGRISDNQFPSPRIRPGFNVALPFACSGFTIATWKRVPGHKERRRLNVRVALQLHKGQIVNHMVTESHIVFNRFWHVLIPFLPLHLARLPWQAFHAVRNPSCMSSFTSLKSSSKQKESSFYTILHTVRLHSWTISYINR